MFDETDATEGDIDEKTRFELELEYIQCLGNPHYLHDIALNGYFEQDTFINYLKYLLYWKTPEYKRFIIYPLGLNMLDLLQSEEFRKELKNQEFVIKLEKQLLSQWTKNVRDKPLGNDHL